MAATIVTRFAPSPTGALHLGHARSALLGWRAARAAGGRFLLRIEDIDPLRCREAFIAPMLADLAWLGLDWKEPPRRQSAHLPEYRAVLDRLAGEGLLYPCFCSRAEIAREIAASGHAPHGPEGPLYPGTCRRRSAAQREARIAAGEPYALRLDMAAALRRLRAPLSFQERGRGRIACDPARFGDAVLARKDIPASYHLCVSHDDALQGVTLVTRGEDLFAATDLQRLLQALLGWPEPEYQHHPLLLGPDGRRLSKRDGAMGLAALREAGESPASVIARALG